MWGGPGGGVGGRAGAGVGAVAGGSRQLRLGAQLPQAVAERDEPRGHGTRAVMGHDAAGALLVAQVERRVDDLGRHDTGGRRRQS